MLFANVEGIFSSIPPIAVFCGLSFLLAIIIPPDYVVLSYISLEVYTNFGMVPFIYICIKRSIYFHYSCSCFSKDIRFRLMGKPADSTKVSVNVS